MARTTHTLLVALVTACSAVSVGSSCAEPIALEAPYEPRDATREVAEALRTELDGALRAYIEDWATAAAFEQVARQHAKAGWNERVRSGIKYADLFVKVYEARQWRKVAAQSDGMRPVGEQIVAAMSTATSHAMSDRLYPIKLSQKLHRQLAEAAAEDAVTWEPVVLTAAEVEAVAAMTRERGFTEVDDEVKQAAAELLLGDLDESDGASASARLRARASEFSKKSAKHAELAAELELRLVDGALRFARDMKYFNLSRQTWKDFKAVGGSKNFIYGRLEEFFGRLAQTSAEDIPALFESVHPQHPQYRALVAARARYQKIVDDGGWRSISPQGLREGAKGPGIAALRERLQLEGLIEAKEEGADGATSSGGASVVDRALLDGVRAYQRTHQLSLKMPPGPTFWRSLNVPSKRRLRQIERALDRWRESRYEGEEDFVWVNLPSFTASVWKGKEKDFEFKVVIGKNNKVCDPEKKVWVYPNATPELVSQLEYFILNPSWYVPERIIREELLPHMAEDEEWLGEHGYEIMEKKGEDDYVIRQIPGPENALGLVKFIFPNPHNTYMHDTARKEYFDYGIRAYSHGCMRVHEPLKLAEKLVELDGQQGVEVREIVESKRTKMIKMNEPLPVFVEYQTVWADEQGRPNFLIDVYHRDQLRDLGIEPGTQACTPAPVPVGMNGAEESSTGAPPDESAEYGDEGRPDTSADVGP